MKIKKIYKNSKKIIFFEKFFCIFFKNGDKNLSLNFFKNILKLLYIKTKKNRFAIIITMIQKLLTYVELRKVKRRRKYFNIPFPVNENRQVYLALSWLFLAVKKNSSKKSLSEKFVEEILKVIRLKNSVAINEKVKMIEAANANISNAHFRW